MNTATTPSQKAATYFVIGESRTNADNAITKKYGSFYMGFEIDGETNTILDFSCTHTLGITERFLSSCFLGTDFLAVGDWLERWLESYYGGSSKRAILTAYGDALKRYRGMRGK